MDRTRGMIVVSGSVALLVAGFALKALVKKKQALDIQEAKETEAMIEQYEEYKAAEAAPKKRARRPKSSAGQNGHMSRAHG